MKTKFTSLALLILAVVMAQTGAQAQSYHYVPPVVNQQVNPTNLVNPAVLEAATQTLHSMGNGFPFFYQ